MSLDLDLLPWKGVFLLLVSVVLMTMMMMTLLMMVVTKMTPLVTSHLSSLLRSAPLTNIKIISVKKATNIFLCWGGSLLLMSNFLLKTPQQGKYWWHSFNTDTGYHDGRFWGDYPHSQVNTEQTVHCSLIESANTIKQYSMFNHTS